MSVAWPFAVVIVSMVRESFYKGFSSPKVFVVVLKPDLGENFYGVFVFPWDLGNDIDFSSFSLFLVDLNIVGEDWQFAEAA